jgi:hypothetical protein
MFIFILAIATALGHKLLQLSDANIALEFPSRLSSPKVRNISATSCLTQVSDFTISAWVKLEISNLSSIPLVSVVTAAGTVTLAVTKEPNNLLVFQSEPTHHDTWRLAVAGATPQVWELVSVTATSNGSLAVCSAAWRGVPHCASTSVTIQPLTIDALSAVLFLGAGPIGPSIQVGFM